MDQTTLNTIETVLAISSFMGIAGSLEAGISSCCGGCTPLLRKKLISFTALAAGSLIGFSQIEVDPIKLEAERIEKREQDVQKEMKQIQMDKQKLELERKKLEFEGKKSELDAQIKALDGVTVVERRPNPFVAFALSRQAQNVKC